MDHPALAHSDLIRRRVFLAGSGAGMGGFALASLFASDARVDVSPPTAPDRLVGFPHFAPRAKRIIFLFMAGAPSQLDLFDDKPMLRKMNGKTADRESLGDVRFSQIRSRNKSRPSKLLGSPYKFQQHGQSGALVSELLPHFSGVVDDVAFLKGMRFDGQVFDHPFAQLNLMTGSPLEGRPSLGAWLSYGLGRENDNLPAFIVLLSNLLPRGGPGMMSSGFLPSVHQGVPFCCQGDPVLFLSNPQGVTPEVRRRTVETINNLNALRRDLVGDPEISTRIAAFEMACRMQTSAPELVDFSNEPQHIQTMYGAEPGKQSFANNCLLARRLVEQGVRIVQLVDLDWDHHGDTQARDLMQALPRQCRSVDRAIAALLRDLKQRGLLDDTLVVWASEFGRTPIDEERDGSIYLGRDHHPFAGTFWMAGAGIKAGMTMGATDELGFQAIEQPTDIYDFQATILHLMGLDHERFTYRFQGRDFRLTDVAGRVIHEVLA
ncbi:DUF1501 domain-containing protein [Schlesneria paludicola]|uniref:DUF1501 domain-containing protein n=1 Tax=Schlesneria paludicola TaxID=360056 RepID=UPI00029ADD7E|nr:DUF1501 domain-containing protein [Schlesneria paludicola]